MKLLRLTPEDTKFPFMRFRRVSYPFSAFLSLVSVALFIFLGMNFGIDFAGGTLMELRAKQGQADLAMLRNLLEPVAERGQLEHVSLLQGTKAYGVHLRRIAVPARERWPRDDHANFYWLQEDLLREIAAREKFGFTIFRPQIIFGDAIGAAMNIKGSKIIFDCKGTRLVISDSGVEIVADEIKITGASKQSGKTTHS